MEVTMKYTKWAPALVLAGLVAACEQSPVGPSPTPQFDHANPGSTPTTEQLKVCKLGDVAGSFSVTYSSPPGNDFGISAFTLNPGECRHIATASAISVATATIVEDAPPMGFHLESIDVDSAGDHVTPASSDVTTRTAVVTIGEDPTGAGVLPGPSGATVTFTNLADPFIPGDEGCTPGYWKQSQHFDSWEGYATGDDFDTVFGVDLFNPDISLLDALNLGGGGVNALARHAVAALLNAASSGVDASLSEAEVIQLVQDAETSGDFEAAKNTLAASNELGCPLN
jgi:hypothetical protein